MFYTLLLSLKQTKKREITGILSSNPGLYNKISDLLSVNKNDLYFQVEHNNKFQNFTKKYFSQKTGRKNLRPAFSFIYTKNQRAWLNPLGFCGILFLHWIALLVGSINLSRISILRRISCISKSARSMPVP